MDNDSDFIIATLTMFGTFVFTFCAASIVMEYLR